MSTQRFTPEFKREAVKLAELPGRSASAMTVGRPLRAQIVQREVRHACRHAMPGGHAREPIAGVPLPVVAATFVREGGGWTSRHWRQAIPA